MKRYLKQVVHKGLPAPATAGLAALASLYRDFRGTASTEAELALLPILCDRNKHSLDIGAHLGAYAYVMSKLSKGVTCIEANPMLAQALRIKFSILRGRNVDVRNVAASNTPRIVELTVPNGMTGLGTLEDIYSDGASGARISVRAITIDELALKDIGFIKIDVEGHETKVLEGASATLKASLPNLLIEAEERHAKGAVASVASFLAQFGYHGFYFHLGRLHALSRFEIDTMQNRAALNDIGTSRRPNAVYINNFVFVARLDVIRMAAALHAA